MKALLNVLQCFQSLIISLFIYLISLALSVIRPRKIQKLHIENYKKDKVYLFLFPACDTIPCISPFALKLETWLRLNNIPYDAIRKAGVWSKQGQIPFIELNGEQIADSNFIITALRRHYAVEERSLNKQEQGIAHAIAVMLDNSTVWSYFYYRYVDDAKKFLLMWKFLPKLVRHLIAIPFPKNYHERAVQHGIGRNPKEKIYEIGNTDLQALSDILGTKKFLFGDEMSTVDCYAFGHLTQLLYIPLDYPQTVYVRKECPNLVEYVDRIKQKLWSDWDELCSLKAI